MIASLELPALKPQAYSMKAVRYHRHGEAEVLVYQEAQEAHRRLQSGEHISKIVLQIGD